MGIEGTLVYCAGKSAGTLVAALLLGAFVLPLRADDPPDPNAAKAPSNDSSTKTPSRRHGAQKKPAPPVLPPLPEGPLQQVPMDQIPQSAPKVTFENGLLTISAKNSTLDDILKKVKELTGASIDLPPGGAPERVVTQLGPGAPRDVLAVLLNGTAFNYVLLGSTSDPSAISSVMLTSKPSSGGPEGQSTGQQPMTMTVYQQAQAMQPGRMMPGVPFRQALNANNQPQAGAAASGDSADDSSDDADDKDDDSDQPPPAQANGGQPSAGAGDANAANPNLQPGQNPNQPNAGPRTPEQLLQMMRQGQQPGAAVPQQPPSPPEQ